MPNSEIEKRLEELCLAVQEIDSYLFVSADGTQVIASRGLPVEPQQVGALSAILLALCQKTTSLWQLGDADYLVLDGTSGKLVCIPVGTTGVLVLGCRVAADTAEIRDKAMRAALDCARLL